MVASSSRRAACSQSTATAGARARTIAAAASSTAADATSPARAQRATWCASWSGGAPRAVSAATTRSCAAIVQPAPVCSATTWRTSGWRAVKRRGVSVGRIRSAASNPSTASSTVGSSVAAAAATRSRSNGSPTTAAPWSTVAIVGGSRRSSSPMAALIDRGRRPPAASRLPGAGELLQEQRVAAAVLTQPRAHLRRELRADQRVGGGRVERADLQPQQPVVTDGTVERRSEPFAHRPRAQGQGEEHPAAGRTQQQREHQLGGSLVGPVQVVEEQHERAGRSRARSAGHGRLSYSRWRSAASSEDEVRSSGRSADSRTASSSSAP